MSKAAITAESIRKYIKADLSSMCIDIFDTVSSTNDICKQKAIDGASEGYIAIASHQTAGRGQKGRKFYSPDSCGIYMSLLLRPDCASEDACFITPAAAVAVAKTLEEISDRKADIKWVNDIFVNKKKVCGILCEAALSLDCKHLDFAVVGVGINLYTPKSGFDSEIKDIAGPVFESEVDTETKCRIVAGVVDRLLLMTKNLNGRTFFEEYRKRLFFLNRKITVTTQNKSFRATAVDIDDRFRLVVKHENGELQTLIGGDISIMP